MSNFKNKFKIKISDLPNNITDNELYDLLPNWDINKIKVFNFIDNSIAYIDFNTSEAGEYFIKAFDKTNFDSVIISVIKV